MLKNILRKSNPVERVLDDAEIGSKIVDKFTDDKGDKWERYEELLDRQDEDRAEARKMYSEMAQKVLHYMVALAIVFGFVYSLVVLLPAIVNGKLKDLDPLAASTLGVLITLVATNISSVRDFLFGSSDSEREVSKTLTQAKNPLDRAKMKHERKLARMSNRDK